MRRLKQWLFGRYFPAEAKVEIAALKMEISRLQSENDRLNAYIYGFEECARLQRRITINNGVTK